MKIKPEQLERALQKKLLPLYWCSTDETLLKQEVMAQLRSAAHAAGFCEQTRYSVCRAFDWSDLESAARSLSLFAEKRVIEVQLQEAKVSKVAATVLQRLFAEPVSETVLLFSSPKMTAAMLKSAWYKALDKVGGHIVIWPIKRYQLPRWIGQRLHQVGFQVDMAVCELLADKVEGNLLAAQQEVEKLTLLYEPGRLSEKQVLWAAGEHAQFSVFDLCDAALLGQSAKALYILDVLTASGTEWILVLWALARDIRLLHVYSENLRHRSRPIDELNKQYKILPSRQKLWMQAVKRLQVDVLECLLQACQLADTALKGRKSLSAQYCLECIVAGLCSGQRACVEPLFLLEEVE